MRAVGRTIAAQAAEEARLCAQAYYNRQAEIPPGCDPKDAAVCGSLPRAAGEQPRGELTPAGATARTKTTTDQVTRISPTVPVDPRRHLQHLLRPTPSSETSLLQTISSRRLRCVETELACRLTVVVNGFSLPAAVNVSMPARLKANCSDNANRRPLSSLRPFAIPTEAKFQGPGPSRLLMKYLVREATLR